MEPAPDRNPPDDSLVAATARAWGEGVGSGLGRGDDIGDLIDRDTNAVGVDVDRFVARRNDHGSVLAWLAAEHLVDSQHAGGDDGTDRPVTPASRGHGIRGGLNGSERLGIFVGHDPTLPRRERPQTAGIARPSCAGRVLLASCPKARRSVALPQPCGPLLSAVRRPSSTHLAYTVRTPLRVG